MNYDAAAAQACRRKAPELLNDMQDPFRPNGIFCPKRCKVLNLFEIPLGPGGTRIR